MVEIETLRFFAVFRSALLVKPSCMVASSCDADASFDFRMWSNMPIVPHTHYLIEIRAFVGYTHLLSFPYAQRTTVSICETQLANYAELVLRDCPFRTAVNISQLGKPFSYCPRGQSPWAEKSHLLLTQQKRDAW